MAQGEAQQAADSRQRAATEDRTQRAEDRGEHFGLRIAKPGTRPKGGSPKDNCELKKGEGRKA